MIRRAKRDTRLTGPRLAAAAAAAVMLTLTSTVTHAAWTASTSTLGSASTGTIALASSGIPGLAFTYPGVSSTTIAPISLSNSGSVALPLTSASISTTGTLSASNVTLTVWQRTGTTCPASIPGAPVSTATARMDVGTLQIPSSFAPVPGKGSLDLCAATTLVGTPAETAGRQITATLTFSGRLGENWVATDASATRSFTQNVAAARPQVTGCAPGSERVWFGFIPYTYTTATISWAPVAGATQYRVYHSDTRVATTTTAQVKLGGQDPVVSRPGNITVTAIINGVESQHSNAVTVTASDLFSGIGGNSVFCGAVQ